MKTTSLRHGIGALCVAVATATTLGVTAGSGAAAAPPEAQNAAGAVAAYLAAHDDHVESSFVDSNGETAYFTDYGLTLDSLLALNAAGAGRDQAAATLDYVDQRVAEYIGDGDPTRYPGSVAKLLIASQANPDSDPDVVGGVNLVTLLKSLETANGRFRDRPTDYSTTFTQAFALIALTKSGETPSKAAKDFLRAQQCPNGGFRQTEAAKPCTTNASADPDSTAIAIQGLLTLPSAATRQPLVDKAAAYLKTLQKSNGGIAASVSGSKPNANTTGLAAASLRAIGKNGMADKAVGYLTSLSLGCTYPAGVQGFIAYDGASRAAAATQETSDDKLRRATPQAVFGITGVTYNAVSNEGASLGSSVLACP